MEFEPQNREWQFGGGLTLDVERETLLVELCDDSEGPDRWSLMHFLGRRSVPQRWAEGRIAAWQGTFRVSRQGTRWSFALGDETLVGDHEWTEEAASPILECIQGRVDVHSVEIDGTLDSEWFESRGRDRK